MRTKTHASFLSIHANLNPRFVPFSHSGIESRDHGRNQDIWDQLVANMLVATRYGRD